MKNLYDIPGFPGYAITRYGRVFKYVQNPRMKNFPIYELQTYLSGYGYKRVSVRGRGKDIHILLALTFIGPKPSPTHIVRHLNGDRLDNRINNLMWGTYQDNSNDSVRHGTSLAGEKNKNAKITAADVVEIRSRFSNGEKRSSLAQEFGLVESSISNIVRRATWANI